MAAGPVLGWPRASCYSPIQDLPQLYPMVQRNMPDFTRESMLPCPLLHAAAVGALALVFAASVAAQAPTNEALNARLLVSARTGDDAGIERALAAGAAVNSRNRFGETALIIALKRNQTGMAMRLIDAGIDIHQPAINGVTALMAAAHGGYVEIVRTLLERGADPTPVDRIKKTAMLYAAGEGHTEVVGLLLARGIDPNAMYANNLTALMWAAGSGHTTTVEALLKAGARVDARDDRGKSANDMASDKPFPDTVRVLEVAARR